MKKLLVLFAAALTVGACSPKTIPATDAASNVELRGVVQKTGMTTYQYGTHTISANQVTYALRSSKVNLDSYVDQEVVVKGVKVAGYPMENGPELVEVTSVTGQ